MTRRAFLEALGWLAAAAGLGREPRATPALPARPAPYGLVLPAALPFVLAEPRPGEGSAGEPGRAQE